MSYWVSTDLDGTLLDHHNYSFEAANEGLRACKNLKIPIILNTSKTLTETREIQNALGITGPMVIENGSALVYAESRSTKNPNPNENIKVFGAQRNQLLEFISHVRATFSWKLEGFNDFSVAQISNLTGLLPAQAKRAADKHYSEPFIWSDSAENFVKFQKLTNDKGFQILKGGRFYHLQGKCTKASALNWIRSNIALLAGFEHLDSADAELIALGDNDNDIAMLETADIAVCIRSANGDYPALANHPHCIATQGIGPIGWAEAIIKIVTNTENNHG